MKLLVESKHFYLVKAVACYIVPLILGFKLLLLFLLVFKLLFLFLLLFLPKFVLKNNFSNF